MFSFWPLSSVSEWWCLPEASSCLLPSSLPTNPPGPHPHFHWKFGVCMLSKCLFYQLLNPWEPGTCNSGLLSMDGLTCDWKKILTLLITVSKWVCLPWDRRWSLLIYGKLSVCDIWLRLVFSSKLLDFSLFRSFRCFLSISDSNLLWVNINPSNISGNILDSFNILGIKNLRIWL